LASVADRLALSWQQFNLIFWVPLRVLNRRHLESLLPGGGDWRANERRRAHILHLFLAPIGK